MLLQGSCHCQRVRFRVRCSHPYPFLLCYCSICRKTEGGGGYGINLGGDNASLEVEGREHVSVYRPLIEDPRIGERREDPGERHFCRHCGSALWAWDPRWPDLVHPAASAIDTDLPVPPERSHMMLGSKASWVPIQAGPDDRRFDKYPDESLAEWHRRLEGLRIATREYGGVCAASSAIRVGRSTASFGTDREGAHRESVDAHGVVSGTVMYSA